jgi:hypothetical protein
MMPDKGGLFVSTDEKQPTKMVIHFGILLKPLDKAFEPCESCDILQSSSLKQRRSSMAFVNVKQPMYLVVEPRTQSTDLRSKSANHQIKVQLLMPLSELRKDAMFSGGAWEVVDSRNRNRQFASSSLGTQIDTPVKEFFKNVYIPCLNTTMVAASCVMQPLVDSKGSFITATNATNILGRLMVKNWPSGPPIVEQYPPRNPTINETGLYSISGSRDI